MAASSVFAGGPGPAPAALARLRARGRRARSLGRLGAAPGERVAPAGQLVEHDAQGEHVALGRGRPPARALGGEVEQVAAARALTGLCGGEREAEVHQHRLSGVVDAHVLGLDVAVHVARRVQRREPAGHLGSERAQQRLGQRTALAEHAVEGLSGHVEHHQLGALGARPGVQDAHQGRVADARADRGLALEGGLGARVPAELGVQHLDGHLGAGGELAEGLAQEAAMHAPRGAAAHLGDSLDDGGAESHGRGGGGGRIASAARSTPGRAAL